jgi:tryptophanyl-tRNA synthetase
MSCPAIQIVPAPFEERCCLIPAAIDQDPYWRIQRDIAESLGFYKAAAIHSRFLTPLTGPAGNMSASQPDSAVFLNDDPKTVRKKIWLAYSGGQPIVEQHRMFDGNPDVDVTSNGSITSSRKMTMLWKGSVKSTGAAGSSAVR